MLQDYHFGVNNYPRDNFNIWKCHKIIPLAFIIIQQTIFINANIKGLSIYISNIIANIIQRSFYQLEFLEVIPLMHKIIQKTTNQRSSLPFGPYNVN